MKRAYNYIHVLVMALLMAFAASCSQDADLNDPSGYGEEVTVRLRLSTSATPTRAGSSPTWTAGTTDENMKSWIVVVAGTDGVITNVISKDNVGDLSEDNVEELTLSAGTYTFYSFANIDAVSLGGPAVGQEAEFDNMEFTVLGNGFDPSSGGIPMSNKQTITITGSTAEVDLWVVRMLAKVELEIKNETGNSIKVKNVMLSDVTANSDKNLMLLPNPVDGAGETACMPNLSSSAKEEDFVYSLPDGQQEIAAEATSTLTFYVNESDTPAGNPHGLFTLAIETNEGDMRYALITNDDDNWDYIARNDYRKIPVTLQNYKLDIIPYDFPPIGVLPASVKEEAGLFTISFHAAGHFHLVPKVTAYNGTGEIPYYDGGSTATCWKYSGWSDVGSVPIGFYVDATTPAEDGCDNGGKPVWVDGSRCIIGNLADGDPSEAFHDLSINVYEDGGTTVARTLTYHLCIVKDIRY